MCMKSTDEIHRTNNWVDISWQKFSNKIFNVMDKSFNI